MSKQQEEGTKASFLNEFLWICAGVDRKILRQCPTDYSKYAGMGGTILFTAVMACLSGGYAIHFVFESLEVAVGFGIVWGLMIFNLDRFMVNTMYSDGKHTISKSEFKGGLPRIILAIFLGIVISTPLEMKIFQDQIKAQLCVGQGEFGKTIRAANNRWYNERDSYEKQIKDLTNQLGDLNSGNLDDILKRIADKQKERSKIVTLYHKAKNSESVTQKTGNGLTVQQLKKQIDRLDKELADLKRDETQIKENNQKDRTNIQEAINRAQRQLDNIDKEIVEVQKKDKEGQEALKGFCAQIKALGKITSPKEDKILFVARLFISLLFISIEVIPTLFKMMVIAGPYDDMLRAEQHRVKVSSDKKISDINDEINTLVTISTEQNKKRCEAEILANKQLLEQIAEAQSQVVSRAIEMWREEEMKKIEENPLAYIQSTTNQNQTS